jgi:hypothetical protein
LRTISATFSCRLLQAGAATVLLAMAACSQLPTTASVTVPSIPAGDARAWFFRDDGPYESHARPAVRMNDTTVGIVEPRGAFYHDVPPGHYHVAVDTYVPDVNATKDVDLASGQQAYFKIVSLNNWLGGGGQAGDTDYSRGAFYVWLIPTAVAQSEVARSPFYGAR